MERPRTAGTRQADLLAEVRQAFKGKAARVPVPILYRFLLLLGAFAMVLLPAVYLGIVAAAAYGVYWHATEHSIFSAAHHGVGDMRVALLFYLAPLFAGVVLVLFLLKPLLAPPSRSSRPRPLQPRSEPRLYAVIEALCHSLGAPAPREIAVDLDVNASAAFRRGFLSFFSDDLSLTIGLPLVAGLSTRALLGVLAHEFGHFAQRTAMRLDYTVRTIDGWLARVVYQRDAWDEGLLEWTSPQGGGQIGCLVAIIAWTCVACVWASRKILWVLMLCGHAICSSLTRQMEFDADRYGVWVAGSDAYAEMLRRLPTLVKALHGAVRDAQASAAEGRLPDDIPMLVAANVERLVAPAASDDDEEVPTWFRSHPPTAARIERVIARKEPGVARLSAPASALFHDFAELSKERTAEAYHAIFGARSGQIHLCPTAELLGRQDSEGMEWNAARQFYLDAASLLRPPRLPGARPVEGTQALARIRASKAAMEAAREAYQAAVSRDVDSSARLQRLAEARSLVSAGFLIEADAFGLPDGSKEAIAAAQAKARGERTALDPALRPFEAAAHERLAALVALLGLPHFAARTEVKGMGATKLLELTSRVAQVLPRVDEIREERAALAALLAHVRDEASMADETLMAAIRSRAGFARKALLGLLDSLIRLPYPFEHASGPASLSSYVLQRVPAEQDVFSLPEACDEACERTASVYFRLLGRLAMLARVVEASR